MVMKLLGLAHLDVIVILHLAHLSGLQAISPGSCGKWFTRVICEMAYLAHVGGTRITAMKRVCCVDVMKPVN